MVVYSTSWLLLIARGDKESKKSFTEEPGGGLNAGQNLLYEGLAHCYSDNPR